MTARQLADEAGLLLASVHHDGSVRYVVPVAAGGERGLRVGDEVRLRVRTGLDAPVERILLRTTPDGEQAFTELAEAGHGGACRWWEVTLRLRMPVTAYRFLVAGPLGLRWLNGSGMHGETPTDRDDFRLVAGFEPPSWLEDRVFYQVFPDRFANGDPANDVADGDWTYRGQPTRRREWDEAPSNGPGGMVEFFGGDLAGLEASLDHLADLGVNAIYLNPVFATRSNHGYDTIDYGHVAAHLGGDDALVSLRRATRDRGMRLILDIAPNHTGAEHPWFLDAQADPAAPTAAYFTFHNHPDEYEAWLGVRSLPKLDYREQALREAMYAGHEAVLRHWLRPPYSIDGWRIDVANMLGRQGAVQLGAEVARGIRTAVKEENPEAWLLGEHFFDATDQLNGDQWDAVMNYAGFATPVIGWLAGVEYRAHGSHIVVRDDRVGTRETLATLEAFRAAVPWAIARAQYNLLGSHDTARIRTVVGGDRGRLRAAVGLLLTYPGVPALFYGDEVGLEGADGPAGRRTMPWARTSWNLDHLAFVRALVRFRTASRALAVGGFQVLGAGEDWLAYLRDTDDEQVIVVAARGPAARPADPLPVAAGAVADGTVFSSLLTGARAEVTAGCLPIGTTPPGVAIWVSRSTTTGGRP